MTERAEPRGGWLRQESVWLLEILALSAFAIAQPVLDVFGRSPETFVFRGAGPADVVLFALVVALVPPVALWGLALLTRPFGARVRGWAQIGILGTLAVLLGIQIFKKTTPLLGLSLLAAGVAVGGLAALLFVRARPARQWLRLASVAPVVFVAIFLFGSASAKLLRAPDVAEPAAPSVVAEETPVVMVVFDEFPTLTLLDSEGGINEDLFPNLAELSRRATWYRDYTTTEPSTNFAVPTVLTGRLATDREKDPLTVDYPENLFTLFRESHELLVFEHITELCPPDLCTGEVPPREEAAGLGTGTPAGPVTAAVGVAHRSGDRSALSALLGDAVGIWRDISLPGEVTRDITGQFGQEGDADQAVAAVPDEETGEGETDEEDDGEPVTRRGPKDRRLFQLMRSLGRVDGPGLYFAHVMLPHSPWRSFPSGMEYGDELLEGDEERPRTTGDPGRRREEEWLVDLTRQRHLLQTQFVDELIGELVRRLENRGLYEETLLVVTADHGLGLGPGRELRNAQWENLHEILWAPLFVKAPGQEEGGPDDTNLMAIDVLPTMAEILGVELPWEVDGLPASDPGLEERRTKLITGWHYLTGDAISHELHEIPADRVEEARRRLRREIFRPADPSAEVRWWPYLVGPAPDLVGKRVGELEVGPQSERSAVLLRPRPGRLNRVDVEEGPLPAFLLGEVEGVSGPLDARVAVVMNGTVAGVSEVFSRGDDHGLFSVLVPDFLFQDGGNELELFLVEGPALRPLPFG